MSGIFSFILILILLIIIAVVVAVMIIFFNLRTIIKQIQNIGKPSVSNRRSDNYSKNSGSANSQQQTTSSSAPNNRKRIFQDDEGEYVDFEETK